MFDGVAPWWESFELWLAQLWFPIQFVLVVAALAPMCAVLAWLIHRTVDAVARQAGRRLDGSGRGESA